MQQHNNYRWKFVRAGGVDQVVIRNGADIAHLPQLDQKLWVALACPTRGVEFAPATLDVIDENGDGRIRAPELIHVCQWALALVRDPEVLASQKDILQLDSLNTESPEGAALLAEAQRILQQQGQAGAPEISLDQVLERAAQLDALPLNGDGILNPKALAEQPELQALAEHIMQAYGAQTGCDEEEGLGQEALEQYQADLQALVDWQGIGPTQSCDLPDPEQAHAAASALAVVQAKLDDFFARCRLAAFDAKAAAPLSPSEEGYINLSSHSLHDGDEGVAALPLAAITPEAVLPLPADMAGINPAWAEAMAQFQQQAVLPLLGAVPSLSLAQWQAMKQRLAPCQDWLAAKPSSPVADMALEDAQTLLNGGALARLQDWIEQDSAEQAHREQVRSLEKLIRLQRDLLPLLNNFVSFSSFYSRQGAIFQAGRLYLDGRSCDLTVDVQDPAAHAALAGLAKTYLAYCECRRDGVVRHIVAAFTAGDVDFLFVGRKGIFYDRAGQDWDATITALIENPTSVGQAFFSPYKKFLRMVEEQVAKRAAAKDAAVTEQMETRAAQVGEAKPADAAALPAKKVDVGTVAAIGVALGSLSTVAVAVLGKFIELGPWIPVALLAVVLAISGPSMLIAWLKLRERSLGPILDASGWAINGRMKINIPLGRSLSQMAQVPAGAERSLHDPYAEPPLLPWLLAVGLLVLTLGFAWSQAWLDDVLPSGMQYQSLIAAQAEAAGAAHEGEVAAPAEAPEEAAPAE